MDEGIWQLPGPARLITETVREVNRGRHAAVVIPAILANDQMFVAGLVRSLTAALWVANEYPKLVTAHDTNDDDGPLQWLGHALEVDDRLHCTAQLLDHPDAAEKTAVFDCSTLHTKRCQEVSAMFTRLVAESRPRPADRRPRLVMVCTRAALPQLGTDHTDVTFETLWWWGRLSRWDIAAQIVPTIEASTAPGVLRDVRLETVIEVCRWDLRLADQLAESWDGDPESLPTLIAEANEGPTEVFSRKSPRNSGRRPQGDLADCWDAGTVNLWHDECTASIRATPATAEALKHAVWAAQARVLMPWIEERRQLVADDLLRSHGRAAVRAVLGNNLSPASNGISEILEVGPLFVAVRELSGRRRPALRDAAFLLWKARNKLAHLQALTTDEQRELITGFAGLSFV